MTAKLGGKSQRVMFYLPLMQRFHYIGCIDLEEHHHPDHESSFQEGACEREDERPEKRNNHT